MTELKEIKITKNAIEKLALLGINSVEDLLTYYPYRYEYFEYVPYEQWKIDQQVIFEGVLISHPVVSRLAGKMSVAHFQVMLEDNLLNITLFNRPWISQIKVGSRIVIIGKYKGQDKISCISYNTRPLNEQLGIKPVYSLKQGVANRTLTSAIDKALNFPVYDYLPSVFKQRYRLLDLSMAYRLMHHPKSQDDLNMALRTLKYAEFLVFYGQIALMSNSFCKENGYRKNFNNQDVFELSSKLPYKLTDDQIVVLNEILKDLHDDKTMYRLVQGDVGCGKTIVASLALYGCLLAGYQAALLAPTEVLALQHYQSIKELYEDTHKRVEVLYNGRKAQDKKQIIEDLKNGKIDLIIGTHSIIQDDILFKNLGLAIIDEQQRFGVKQRQALSLKGKSVDFLLMSATPIPRTLANSLYGDLEVSTIETMPAMRKGIDTYLVKENSIRSLIGKIKDTINEGNQVYIVCASIQDSEMFNLKNVLTVTENLKKVFAGFCNVEMMHGKMTSEEKNDTIKRFINKEFAILVSTTVVEVGVNVVDATMMIIYDSYRFGLSQLHQLRGRVQRGSKRGQCYLLTNKVDDDTLKRLNILVKSTNGFEISQEDLLIRGPGDILGTRQSGLSGFILGDIFKDHKIIEQARKDIKEIFENRDSYLEFINYLDNLKTSYID